MYDHRPPVNNIDSVALERMLGRPCLVLAPFSFIQAGTHLSQSFMMQDHLDLTQTNKHTAQSANECEAIAKTIVTLELPEISKDLSQKVW